MLRHGVRSTAVGIVFSAAALMLSSVGAMAASPWTTQTLDAMGHYHGVFAIDGCHVWAVGEEVNGRSQIFHTTDGGTTWSQIFASQFVGIGATFNRVLFTDTKTGYIVGERDNVGEAVSPNPNFLRTTDGGATWTDLRTKLPAALDMASDTNGLLNPSDLEGLAAIGSDVWVAFSGFTDPTDSTTDRGMILHSPDGGNTWDAPQLNLTGTNAGMASVAMADKNNGWAVGDDGKIYNTTNGGGLWTNVATKGGNLEGVAAIDTTHAVVVGSNGQDWVTTDGTTFNAATRPGSVGTSTLNDVAFGSSTLGYIVGELGGNILKSVDSGLTWTSESSNDSSNNDLSGVGVVPGGTFAWAGGGDGIMSANTPATTSCVAAAAAPAAVVPKLPNAGHPLMPTQYDWMLLLLIPAIGVLGWISVKPD